MRTIFEKTKRFREGEYGFFFHFLQAGDRTPGAPSGLKPYNCWDPSSFLTPEQWNEVVDRFDVERFAWQMNRLHAGHVMLTTGQNSGFLCTPNSVLDRIMGWTPETSHCSRRDLIADFSDALAKYGIDLYAYSTCNAPTFDPEICEKLHFLKDGCYVDKKDPDWESNMAKLQWDLNGPEPERIEFQKLWNEIHLEWALRWGTKIKGWWIDGVGRHAQAKYHRREEPNGRSFYNALTAGNPDALVGFSPGLHYPTWADPLMPQDYTAGECNFPELSTDNRGPLIENLQYHILAYTGITWRNAKLRADADYFVTSTRSIADNGGVVTWDVFFALDGIPEPIFKTLTEFADRYRESKKLFPENNVFWTDPILNSDGSKIPGKAEITSREPVSFKAEWNGKTFEFGSSCRHQFELSCPEKPREQLILSCNGITKKIMIWRQQRGPSIAEQPFRGKLFDRNEPSLLLGEYSLSASGGDLIFAGNMNEESGECRELPWEGACTELITSLSGMEGKFQICIRPDGTTIGFPCGILIPDPVPYKAYSFEKNEKGYSFSMRIPMRVLEPSFRSQFETLAFTVQHRGIVNGRKCFSSSFDSEGFVHSMMVVPLKGGSHEAE